jgi:hypothetical protein
MADMEFEIGEWYITSDGDKVEFIKPIERDGMYNVFRHTDDMGYAPLFIGVNGITPCGVSILSKASQPRS